MITVGFGDFSPQNPLEVLVNIFTMLVSCGVYAYILNKIGSIFEKFSARDDKIKRDHYIINSYMNKKQINKDLQQNIRQYLDFYWRSEDQLLFEEESKIINQLSDALRQNLQIEANSIILENSQILSSTFSEQVLLRTISKLKECTITPEEIIFNQADFSDSSIYFVESGKVELYFERNVNGQTYS